MKSNKINLQKPFNTIQNYYLLHDGKRKKPSCSNALNSLPELQSRWVDAHIILGKTYLAIAQEEGVDKSAVRRSVLSRLVNMRKYIEINTTDTAEAG